MLKLRPKGAIPDEIPTSSTADIAFLLVVFFMLTLVLTATSGLDLDLGEEAEGPIDPVESVLVEVGRAGSLSVDRRPLALDQLLERLAPILAQDARKPVIVIAVDGAEYGDMVNVLDELRQGKRKLGLEHDIQIALPTERESLEWRYAVSGG